MVVSRLWNALPRTLDWHESYHLIGTRMIYFMGLYFIAMSCRFAVGTILIDFGYDLYFFKKIFLFDIDL